MLVVIALKHIAKSNMYENIVWKLVEVIFRISRSSSCSVSTYLNYYLLVLLLLPTSTSSITTTTSSSSTITSRTTTTTSTENLDADVCLQIETLLSKTRSDPRNDLVFLRHQH